MDGKGCWFYRQKGIRMPIHINIISLKRRFVNRYLILFFSFRSDFQKNCGDFSMHFLQIPRFLHRIAESRSLHPSVHAKEPPAKPPSSDAWNSSSLIPPLHPPRALVRAPHALSRARASPDSLTECPSLVPSSFCRKNFHFLELFLFLFLNAKIIYRFSINLY